MARTVISSDAGAVSAQLRILATSDLHVCVYPYDYFADRETHSVGLARTASIIAELRAGAPNCLLFDNGDFLQGNPLGDFAAGNASEPGWRHPMVEVMRQLRYDAAGLGNHEFDWGLPFLKRALEDAGFPILCANLKPADTFQPFWSPYAILERQLTLDGGGQASIRIGVIGLLPPQVTKWNAHHLDGVVASHDIVATASQVVPRMRAEGADLVIALAHTGIDPATDGAMRENAALALASVTGIDAIVAGHQHLRLPGKDFAGIAGVSADTGSIRGVPCVMPGFGGSDLGAIDLALTYDGTRWMVQAATARLHPIGRRSADGWVPLVPSDRGVLAAAAAPHEETLASIRRPIGATSASLHSYFSVLKPTCALQLVSDAQLWHAGQMIAGGPLDGLPLLCAGSLFKAGGRGGPGNYTDIPAGPLAVRNVSDLYSYPNELQIVDMSGEGLAEWLEMSASIFSTLAADGIVRPLLLPGAAPYNFDVMDGLAYRIDLSKPARYDIDGKLAPNGGRRIGSLRYMDQPVATDRRFLVVTNSFRASGGGRFPGLGIGRVVASSHRANRDVLAAYIAERGTVHCHERPIWQFAETGGALVHFDTGPGAARHLHEIARFAPVAEGMTEEGYVRYRMTLP
ncbi:bifunctional 2',3'-cyclic-nucleotide 2'-phosphodiesterase/3'-nucleotidase [Aureimonas altamirensis]|uniref:bifunctional 2',3'-cyclic-nucleotide 2'-phosphodiesterase/3'-nucleotidase n=1 Tax=Aureimonas altamirensis TaxID=370622 RepID=UPI00203752DF|nr:bifunctional 2',3'-cyclic-nucleotide 2'-phosphodiesterase/3'-nucleotidase [Aureimonas altamirensis]MCM2503029.1 bifunctional 2',3'-cyclic-nucleotide 2'-phosphodiesterase/3'-nucleotidase [Aureimonas altamirensis]